MSEAIDPRVARREGRVHYGRAVPVYLSGALAALAVLYSPVVIELGVTAVAYIGSRLQFGQGFSSGFVSQNLRWIDTYVSATIWPFGLVVAAIGILMTWLRRKHGLYKREIPTPLYHRRPFWRAYAHPWVAYAAGPAVMFAMAYYYDPETYAPLLKVNFAIWLASGLAGYHIWRLLQDSLLVWWVNPKRRLDVELAVKEVLEADPALALLRVDEIRYDQRARSVAVTGGPWDGPAERRLRELLGRIDYPIDEVALRASADERRPAGLLWWL